MNCKVEWNNETYLHTKLYLHVNYSNCGSIKKLDLNTQHSPTVIIFQSDSSDSILYDNWAGNFRMVDIGIEA